ncbi:hypothetical protein WA026_001622 [Henosepilachna vigintioctopunctata]|uniref:Uncharacterized protein n=1 Tax=Henosepilachna vigintioctopunctata TaxID=420089 RepID=A0AAW1UTZ7_9CUCU
MEPKDESYCLEEVEEDTEGSFQSCSSITSNDTNDVTINQVDETRNEIRLDEENERINHMSQQLMLLGRRQILNNLSYHSLPNIDLPPSPQRDELNGEEFRISYLLGQGDNGILENFWRNINQNIVFYITLDLWITIKGNTIYLEAVSVN